MTIMAVKSHVLLTSLTPWTPTIYGVEYATTTATAGADVQARYFSHITKPILTELGTE